MQPSRALWLQIAELLADDANTLAPAVGGCKVHLAAAPFTPSLDLELGDLTEATFAGSTAKLAAVGAQETGIDLADGMLTITMKEPLGGWRWVCTAVPGVPETIYGYYLTSNDSLELYGSALLTAPVTVSGVGEFVEIANATFKFLEGSPV